MSFNNLILQPDRNFSPYDVRGKFRTDYTGQAGYLVKVSAFDPDSDTYYAQGQSIGASYDGIYANKQLSPWVVSKAGATDTAGSILGITLQGTASVDNHGNKVEFNDRWLDENDYAVSGKPVQIATRGNFLIHKSQFAGNPQPNSGLVPAAGGTFTVVDPANQVATKTGQALVGKVLSSASTRTSGVYVELAL